MKDDELAKKLAGMQLSLPDDPGFQRSVFQRIHHLQESPPISEVIQNLYNWIARPKIMLPSALAVLAISAALAVHNGRESNDQTWTELSANYGQRINPLWHSR